MISQGTGDFSDLNDRSRGNFRRAILFFDFVSNKFIARDNNDKEDQRRRRPSFFAGFLSSGRASSIGTAQGLDNSIANLFDIFGPFEFLVFHA